MKKSKGLFLSHLDDKSGAPKALHTILKFILTQSKIDVDIFVCQPKTVGFFENLKNNKKGKGLVKVKYLKSKKISNVFLIRKLENLFNRKIAKIHAKQTLKSYHKNYDFIFFNSISYNFHKAELDKITIPKYLYLHEGSFFLYEHIKEDYSIFNKFDHIFVPSKQVEENLINHGIASNKIKLLQLFLNDDEINNSKGSTSKKENFVVGNLAHLYAGKGIEYFLVTAKLYKELYPNDKIIFKWKGYNPEASLFNLTNYEIQNAGLKDVVFLEEYSNDTNEFLSGIDVLLMTSKQETFGYVVLEAANNCVPSISFDEVIGASEFIKEYGGFVAKYLSINQLVTYLKKYYDDRNMLNSIGNEANKLLKSNYSLNDKLKNDLKAKLSFIIN